MTPRKEALAALRIVAGIASDEEFELVEQGYSNRAYIEEPPLPEDYKARARATACKLLSEIVVPE